MNLRTGCSCGYDAAACGKHWQGLYYGKGAPPAAAIALSESYESLMARVKNGKRDARYADRMGCFVEQFDYASWRADICAIHHSLDKRSGGAMKGHYKDSLEQMGGATGTIAEPAAPVCPYHWRRDFGIFAPEAGEVDDCRRLVGYIGLVRVGDTATYMQIMGHGDWLNSGVMYRLHFETMRWCFTAPDLEGVSHVWYTNFRGAPGLALWKRKAGFQEVAL